MEGTSRTKNKERRKKVHVHREFECSRIEQAMLAAAYRSILPEERLKLAQRNNGHHDNYDGHVIASHDNSDSKSHHVSATGGHRR